MMDIGLRKCPRVYEKANIRPGHNKVVHLDTLESTASPQSSDSSRLARHRSVWCTPSYTRRALVSESYHFPHAFRMSELAPLAKFLWENLKSLYPGRVSFAGSTASLHNASRQDMMQAMVGH